MRKSLFIAILMLIVSSAQATVYHVAASGGNYTTIAQVNAATFSPGDQVLFNRGETFYGTLIPHNSGVSGNPIIYGAYGTGADPIITGFTTLTGWTSEGSSIYSKVISSLDEAQTNMVLVDGVQVAMGRFPDTTWLTYESFVTNTSITDNTLGDVINWTGAEAVIQKNNFSIQREKITGHSINTLTYAAHGWNGSANKSYFIQNDLRCVTATNEWYHDFLGTGKFYIYGDPTAKTVKVATLNYLFYNNGYNYITIDHISFIGSIDNAVYCPSASNMTIQNCSLSFTGQDAIRIIGTSKTINANTINNCNRSAIYCQGATGTVTNNTISNIGLIYGQATDGTYSIGMSMDGNSYLVQYNNFANCAYNGVLIQGGLTDITVKNNLIENTCASIMTDGGAIYTTGAQTNVLIDGNIIVTGNSGIYMDETSVNITVQNNTVTGCIYAAIKLHKGYNNSILNNTCYGNRSGLDLENWSGVLAIHDNIITGNIFFAKSSTDYTIWIQSDNNDYLQFGTSDYNYITRPINETASIYSWVLNAGVYKTLATWRTYTGQDAHSMNSPYLVTSESELYLAYNTGKIAQTVSLTGAWKDLSGTVYYPSITIQPYTSKILFTTYIPSVIRQFGQGNHQWKF